MADNGFIIGWLAVLALALPLVGYAEIHLTGGLWKGRLFRKEPEIVVDMPWRITQGHPLPIFLFVNDAHRFPIHLLDVTVEIQPPQGIPQRYQFTFNELMDTPLTFRKMAFPADFFPQPGQYLLHVWIRYRRGNREFRAYQDNYPHSHKPAYAVMVDPHPLPAATHWHWGDVHTHSAYTRDLIEFGPTLPALAEAAQAMGLAFVGVTDHSYDFTTTPGAPAAQPAEWEQFLQETETINTRGNGAVLVPGEEVSVKNSKGAIVHALVLGSGQFFPGNTDGALRFGNSGEAFSLPELIQAVQQGGGLLIAAHPLEAPPRSQRVLLQRGYWHATDLHRFGVNHWQIHNGMTNKAFHLGVNHWILALLNGQHVGILAGTDAHGSFNVNRHIAIPLLSLKYTHHQLLGQARTAVHVEGPLTPASILNALARHRTVISTGPFCTLHIQGPNTSATIGDTVSRNASLRLVISAKSAPVWGTIRQIVLFWGTRGGEREQVRHIPVNSREKYYFATEEALPEPDTIQYIRAQLFTENGTQVYFCLTNPIWFQS